MEPLGPTRANRQNCNWRFDQIGFVSFANQHEAINRAFGRRSENLLMRGDVLPHALVVREYDTLTKGREIACSGGFLDDLILNEREELCKSLRAALGDLHCEQRQKRFAWTSSILVKLRRFRLLRWVSLSATLE